MSQTRAVTRDGLRRYLKRHVALCQASPYVHCGKDFSTLDGRVCFNLWVEDAFDSKKEVDLWLMCHSGKVRVVLNARKWYIRISFAEETTRKLPKYIKAYHRDMGSRQDDQCDLLEIQVHDPPTEAELDRVYISCVHLQNLGCCGCGRYTGVSMTPGQLFCDSCELSGCADEQEVGECIICMEPVIAPHLHKMPCCGVVTHRSCHDEWENGHGSRCIHCRQGRRSTRTLQHLQTRLRGNLPRHPQDLSRRSPQA